MPDSGAFLVVVFGAFALVLSLPLFRLLNAPPSENPDERREQMRAFAASNGFEFHEEPNYLLQSHLPEKLTLFGRAWKTRNVLYRVESGGERFETMLFDEDRRVEEYGHGDSDRTWTERDMIFAFRIPGRRFGKLPFAPGGFSLETEEDWLIFRLPRIAFRRDPPASLDEAYAVTREFRDRVAASGS